MVLQDTGIHPAVYDLPASTTSVDISWGDVIIMHYAMYRETHTAMLLPLFIMFFSSVFSLYNLGTSPSCYKNILRK